MDSSLQLKVIEGPGLDEVHLLDTEHYTLGRGRNPGDRAPHWIFLWDKAVSRQHAELFWDRQARAYRLEHRSQTNATWVNGMPVTDPVVLTLGDQIRMAGVVLQVQPAESPAPLEEPAARLAPPALPEPGAARLASPALLEPSAATPSVPLRRGGAFELRVTAGPDQGAQLPLTGSFVTLGRGSLQLQPTPEDPRVFEQLLELTDPSLQANHLILEWQELSQAFRVLKHPQAPPVRVKRSSDGLLWEAWLLNEGLVREQDLLVLGDTSLHLRASEPEEMPTRRIKL